jgi:hypothetical protein
MIIELVVAYIRERLLATLLNVALLALSVAALVLLLFASSQIGERLERNSQGIDLVVGAKGSPLQLILSSIYQMDRPTGNIRFPACNACAAIPVWRRWCLWRWAMPSGAIASSGPNRVTLRSIMQKWPPGAFLQRRETA